MPSVTGVPAGEVGSVVQDLINDGADEIVDFTKEDVVDRVMELTGGQGVDTAIENDGADEIVVEKLSDGSFSVSAKDLDK